MHQMETRSRNHATVRGFRLGRECTLAALARVSRPPGRKDTGEGLEGPLSQDGVVGGPQLRQQASRHQGHGGARADPGQHAQAPGRQVAHPRGPVLQGRAQGTQHGLQLRGRRALSPIALSLEKDTTSPTRKLCNRFYGV